MGEYFKPWRRKAGCVTLVIVCLVTIARLRSVSKQETIFLSHAQDRYILRSVNDWVSVIHQVPYSRNREVLTETTMTYHWELDAGIEDRVVFAVPYFCVHLYAASLYVCLLLSKSRPANKPPEST